MDLIPLERDPAKCAGGRGGWLRGVPNQVGICPDCDGFDRNFRSKRGQKTRLAGAGGGGGGERPDHCRDRQGQGKEVCRSEPHYRFGRATSSAHSAPLTCSFTRNRRSRKFRSILRNVSSSFAMIGSASARSAS